MKDRLNAALVGNLEQFMAEELDLAKRAVTQGVHGRATVVKHALRADVLAAGLGRRLSKSWQQENYPRRRVFSLNAASFVFSKAEELISVFDADVTIRGVKRRFLAIPTPSAPRPRGNFEKRITPENFPVERFGPLRFVYVPGGTSLLVVDNQRSGKKGYALSKSKRALKSGYGLHTVPMFWLVPQVRLRRRLNVDAVERAALSGLAADIDSAFRTLPRRRLR